MSEDEALLIRLLDADRQALLHMLDHQRLLMESAAHCLRTPTALMNVREEYAAHLTVATRRSDDDPATDPVIVQAPHLARLLEQARTTEP